MTTRRSPISPTFSAEGALQQDGVQPATVFEADRGQPARIHEAAVAVQGKGSLGIGVHDDGDDLPNTCVGAPGEQRIQQVPADATADGTRRQVDRVLHGVAVGGAWFPLRAIGIAGYFTGDLGSEEWQPAAGDRAETSVPLPRVGRLRLECRDAARNMVGVDGGDRVQVSGRRGPDGLLAHVVGRQQLTGSDSQYGVFPGKR